MPPPPRVTFEVVAVPLVLSVVVLLLVIGVAL